MVKFVVIFLVVITLAVIYCSLYALIYGKHKWILAIVSTTCTVVLVLFILHLLGITNYITIYLGKPKWVMLSMIIWIFTIAIILDKVEERQEDERQKKAWLSSLFLI